MGKMDTDFCIKAKLLPMGNADSREGLRQNLWGQPRQDLTAARSK